MGGYATNPDTNSASEITGSGTANYLAKFTSAQTIGNSNVTDDGTYVAIATQGLTVRVSDGRVVSNYPQASLSASFGHTFASPYADGTSNAFTIGTSGLSSSLFTLANSGAFEIGYLASPQKRFGFDGTSTFYFLGDSELNVGINVYPTNAKFQVVGTTEQTRIAYDANNYLSTTIGSTGVATINAVGTVASHKWTTGVATSGNVTSFTFTQPANTGQTASTETVGWRYVGATRSWAAGAITTQREFYISSSTYAFASASTITNAYGLYVESPTAGSNATITNNYALGLAGSLLITGGLSLGYVEKTSGYTLTGLDLTVNCTSGTFNATLPTAVGISGKIFVIKNSGAGTITVNTTSSQTIDGSLTQTLASTASIWVQSNGANWIILA